MESNRRNVWISCYGVPLHGWSCATFKKIAQRWGEAVYIEEATAKGLSFAAGKVLISTDVWDRINEVVQLVIKGKVFDIKVVEEQVVVLGHCSICNISFSDSDELSNSPKSVDDSVDEANSKRGEDSRVQSACFAGS